MTPSQFILGTALLCVSGTLAFFISFREQGTKSTETALGDSPNHVQHRSPRSQRSTPLPFGKTNQAVMDPTNHEVSVSELSLQSLSEKIEADSRQRLQKMTELYQLTANQRREIFPLLVSHHPEFQEGLIVNGSAASRPTESKLASEVYPLLDLTQQEAYQETLLAGNDWWSEIIEQLRDDLDKALESGEVEIITESEDAQPTLGNELNSAKSDLDN